MASQHFYMIGKPVLGYNEVDKLPRLSQVLKNFFYHHFERKLGVHKSAYETCAEVISLCEKMTIPTQQIGKAVEKLKQSHVEWQFFKKYRNRKKDVYNYDGRCAEFMSKLNKEFDIRAQTAPVIAKKVKSVVQIPSVVQIAPSQYSLGKRKRSAFENAKDNIAKKRSRLDSVLGEQTTSSGSESPHSNPDNPVKKLDFINENIVTTCDGVGLTSWQAIKIISAVAQGLGHDLNKLKISHSTLYRRRKKSRKQIAKRIKDRFKAKNATVHWDTKQLPHISGEHNKKVDRMPVLISQESGVQLLGVPFIKSGTGELMAEAVYDTLREWNALENIECVSFDRTSSNTGKKLVQFLY